jgi:hypothetical protein
LRNKFSLPLLLLTLLDIIALVFNIFSDAYFLQKPSWSTAFTARPGANCRQQ